MIYENQNIESYIIWKTWQHKHWWRKKFKITKTLFFYKPMTDSSVLMTNCVLHTQQEFSCWLSLYWNIIWALSSEFVSSSIPSWQISTVHVQPFRGARDLAFCLNVPLDSLLVWASSEGSGETARMRRLAWTFAARIGDKYQIRLTRSILWHMAWCHDIFWW